MKKWLVAVFLVFIPFSVWGDPPEIQPERVVTLLFSSNNYGEVEPCG
jgi:hypothetical protein